MALQSTGHPEAYPLAVEWSARGAKFEGEWDVRKHWDSFNAGKAGGITIATLFKMALDAGWCHRRQM
ncbi:MAG: PriCT-2 domain-containing protein [Comamonadaceae bacterium]|nr:PriCT-2 domain-containing protein [Comamonadaceae bacterium]